jgi:tetratricopeptide (TPR) repeat protein
MAETKEGSSSEMSLKDQGNEFFKSGKYLKAAALYTQAIKKDPSNPTLYRYHTHFFFLSNFESFLIWVSFNSWVSVFYAVLSLHCAFLDLGFWFCSCLFVLCTY